MTCNSAGQTKNFAARLAKMFLKGKKRSPWNALVLALTGDLGSGKTTFAQGFLRALGVKRKITSPTFVLIKNHRPKAKKLRSYKLAYHIDCYRIKKTKEVLDLGLREILSDPQHIVLIEWPEKIKKFLPKNRVWINFKHGERENIRLIRIDQIK